MGLAYLCIHEAMAVNGLCHILYMITVVLYVFSAKKIYIVGSYKSIFTFVQYSLLLMNQRNFVYLIKIINLNLFVLVILYPFGDYNIGSTFRK